MIGWEAAAAALAGAAAGGGLWLLLAAATGHLPGWPPAALARWRAGATSAVGRRLLAAAAAGAAVLALTRWVAVAAAVGLVVAAWPRLFGAAGEQRRVVERLEALAGWVEALRDTIGGGLALPEAIPLTAAAAPPAIRPPLDNLVFRMKVREPLDRALLALADDLDDPVADQAVAALALNARAQGRALKSVLTALAASTRAQVEMRRAVDAERRSTRRALQIIMGVTAVVVVGLAVFNRDYVAPFATPAGQVVLAVDVAIFVLAFAWLRQLATFVAPTRFLTLQDTRDRSVPPSAGRQPTPAGGRR